MSTKHTPGPWTLRDIGTEWAIYGAGKRTTLATIERDGPDRGEANARLVAAAPQMLDLLKRAASSLQEYCAAENGDMNDALAMEIYAAIAEATGETP